MGLQAMCSCMIATIATPSTWGRGTLSAAEGSMLPCRPAAGEDLQLCSCHSCQLLWLDQQLGGCASPLGLGKLPSGAGLPWPLAVSTTADVSPRSGVDKERPRRRAGSRPCGLPASTLASPANSRRTSSVLVQPPRQSVSRRDGRPPHGLCPPAGAGPPAALPALRRLPAHRGRRAVQRGAQEVDPAEAAAR